MFVHYFTEAAVSLERAVRAITGLQLEMSTWAGSAYRNGEALAGRLGGKTGLASLVLFEIGNPQETVNGHNFSVQWRATGAASLFPRLQADLELADLGETVLVTLRGSYDPPLGEVGRLVDRAILGRVADATVKSWVDRLALELVDSTGDDDFDSRARPRPGNDGHVAVES
ncbi:MAG TPA: hypothetical protein VM470_07875 [Acidimicrobiia bacterium]|nr:hypothetical protein [Acidimicrobiia bacterium]